MNGFTDKPKQPWEEVLPGGTDQNLFMSPQVKPPEMGTIVPDVGTVSTPRESWKEILKPQKQGPAPAQAKEPWETILKPEPQTREDFASLFLPKVRPIEPEKPSLMGELGKGIMQGLYQTKEMAGGLMSPSGMVEIPRL